METGIGLTRGASAGPSSVLAFLLRAASITPALLSFLRWAPVGPPGGLVLSVSFAVAVWPPPPRERPTHQL